MHIDVGWSADGAGWADAGSFRGSRGIVRMGPRALTTSLQTRLGLTRPSVEQAVRIAQYMRLVEQHVADLADPQDFWPSRSFAVDPWSTARQLLRWRDAAVETGWRAPEVATHLPARLAALRDIEQTVAVGMPGTAADGRPATLSPSSADDLVEILALLEELHASDTTWPLGIDGITLEESPAELPGLWPRLFHLLESAGVALHHAAADHGPAPELTVVHALDEWSAADVAARFLAAPPADDGPLTVLATSDTDVLDRALHRRALPAVGAVAPSSDRAHHQVLGLFLDVATAPVDVHQLAALLDLRVLPGLEPDAAPVGLIPAAARHQLLQALTREPGVGGPAWRDGLRRLDQRVADATADRRRSAEKALEAARVIDRLVADPLPADALRPPAIATRLDWLVERLQAVAHGEGDLLASLTQVRTLQQVLGMLDPAGTLSRRTLQQIIDTCGGSGPSPRARREVSPWAVTTRPAQVDAAGGTVLWWGPTEDGAPHPTRWDPAETTALEAAGGHVVDPQQVAALHVDAALRGLHSARRVVAILPGRRLEETPGPSGLLAHLEAADDAHLTPEALVTGTTWSLAGRNLPVRTPAEQHPAPPLENARRIDAAAHLLPTRLSYTQADTLIACPQHWVLQYALGIRPASVAVLPTGNRMIGTLVHAVVETLVQERFDPAVGGAPLTAPTEREISEVFDRLVPQFASELDLPGHAAERADVRERALRSLGELFTGTARAGLRITGTESRFEEPLTLPLARGERIVEFVGSRDIDARYATGRPMIIDLKWSQSRTRYGDLYDTGEAIQLASYAWSLSRSEPSAEPAQVGYFLLRSGEFVAADPVLDPHRRTPLDVHDAWDRLVTAVTTSLDEVAAGTVTAGCRTLLDEAGLDIDAAYDKRRRALTTARQRAREAGGLLVENHCADGDYAQLCGLTGDWR